MLLTSSLWLGVLLICLTLPALARQELPGADGTIPTGSLLPEMEPGSKSVTFQVGFYNQPDGPGDGNPFLDEALTVIEPILIFDHDVSEDFGYSIDLNYDFVSSASIDRLSNFPEQSGASSDNYIGVDFSFRHRQENDDLFTWHAGYSVEYDYNSFGLGASYAWQPHGKDAILTLGLDGYYDDLLLISGVDGTESGNAERLSLTFNADWYQILSPTLYGEFGASLAHQDGFLSTPYNFVVLEGGTTAPVPPLDNGALGELVDEALPDSRTRLALYGRVRRQMTSGRAWELGGRLYGDSWDIYSVSLEPAYIHALFPELLMEVSYRLYTQTAAEDFEENLFLGNTEEFRTQDSDLGDFSSHTAGLALEWQRSKTNTLRAGINYQLRSDGLDHFYGYIGWTRSVF